MSASAIALFSSGRRHGNTGQLIDTIAAGANLEVVDLAPLDIAPYDYEHSNRDDDFEPLMQRVLDVPRIVFATPVYWYGPNGPMKIFLDRVCDLLDLPELKPQGRRLREKTAYVVSTSIYPDAPEPFVEMFRDTFEYLGMRYGGIAHLDCRDGYDADAAAPVAAEMVARLAGSPENSE